MIPEMKSKPVKLKPAGKMETLQVAEVAFLLALPRYFIVSPQPSELRRHVFVVATPTPIALTTTGFAGEEIKEVKIEGDFKAELKREPEGWVARAEVFNVPAGSKVQFSWITTEGVEKFRKEVELRKAFDNWQFAEAKVASLEEQFGEGYFMAVLIPPL